MVEKTLIIILWLTCTIYTTVAVLYILIWIHLLQTIHSFSYQSENGQTFSEYCSPCICIYVVADHKKINVFNGNKVPGSAFLLISVQVLWWTTTWTDTHMGLFRVILSHSTSTWVQLVPSLTSLSMLCITRVTCWMTGKPFRYVACITSLHCIALKAIIVFYFNSLLFSPPDLHLLCVSDSCSCQCSVVWPNDIRNHGRHAPYRTGVRTGSGYRPHI